MNELRAFPTGRCFQGSQPCLPNAKGGSTLCRGAPATRGRCGPPLPGAAEPARWVFLSPSRALSSRPHIRVWSAAAAVSVAAVASGAGPGRSKWRRREAERRPRSALNPRNFRLEAPQLFREVLPLWGRGRKGKARREVLGEAAGSRRDSNPRRRRWRSPPQPRTAAAPASFPVFFPRPPRRSRSRALRGASSAAARRAQPGSLPATSGPCSSDAPQGSPPLRGGGRGGEGGRAARSTHRPGVAGPSPRCCMRGGVAVSGGEDGRFNAERCGAEILLGSLLLLRHREHQEGVGQRASAGAVSGRAAAQRRGPPGNAAASGGRPAAEGSLPGGLGL